MLKSILSKQLFRCTQGKFTINQKSFFSSSQNDDSEKFNKAIHRTIFVILWSLTNYNLYQINKSISYEKQHSK